MHRVYPPKFWITIVLDFSWDDCNTPEKLETAIMQILGGGGVGGGNKEGALWSMWKKWIRHFKNWKKTLPSKVSQRLMGLLLEPGQTGKKNWRIADLSVTSHDGE